MKRQSIVDQSWDEDREISNELRSVKLASLSKECKETTGHYMLNLPKIKKDQSEGMDVVRQECVYCGFTSMVLVNKQKKKETEYA